MRYEVHNLTELKNAVDLADDGDRISIHIKSGDSNIIVAFRIHEHMDKDSEFTLHEEYNIDKEMT